MRNNGFPSHPFLNDFLIKLEGGNASFLATGVFGGLSIYLIWCTIKGNFKFGVGIPYCFTIHPMK